MKCPICKIGETRPGKATVTLERDQLTLVVRGVPASVCENCGEEYMTDSTTGALMGLAEDAARHGTRLEVRDYVAA